MRKFPLIERLVPVHITNNWWWGHVQLQAIGISLNPIDLCDDELEAITNKVPFVDKSLSACIYMIVR